MYPWGNEFMKDGRWMANTHQGHFPHHAPTRMRMRASRRWRGSRRTVTAFTTWPETYGSGQATGIATTYYASLAAANGIARNPKGPDSSSDPSEPGVPKRVHRGGSYLCTDQYCSRYMVGTRGKGESSTGTNHLGFRLVKDAR